MGWAERANPRAQLKRVSVPAKPKPIKPISLRRRSFVTNPGDLGLAGVMTAALMRRRAGRAS